MIAIPSAQMQRSPKKKKNLIPSHVVDIPIPCRWLHRDRDLIAFHLHRDADADNVM
jgi:hypothetical protein